LQQADGAFEDKILISSRRSLMARLFKFTSQRLPSQGEKFCFSKPLLQFIRNLSWQILREIYCELMARLVAKIAVKAYAWQMKWKLNLKFNSVFIDKILRSSKF
ncbi:hypothetical protein, partial [uncultured Campylobacter sp.]|uniref:hypothetical protein n=1 Tax=uncultured Campylobacter sp. TaxID=218934 RepID=UPI002623B595